MRVFQYTEKKTKYGENVYDITKTRGFYTKKIYTEIAHKK